MSFGMIMQKQNCIILIQTISLYTKTADIYKGIEKYVKTRFDISKYELDRPFPKGKKK